jgi:PAS domain-containing protein
LADKSTGATSDVPYTPSAATDPEGLGLDVLAAIVRASPDAVVVLDSARRVVYASPAYCELFGYPIDRLLGQDALTWSLHGIGQPS